MYLNEKEKELISKKIENLEKYSSTELVAVITKNSSDYKLASAMVAVFSLFVISIYLIFIKDIISIELIQFQILIFVGIYLFFEKFKKFLLLLLPRSYKYQVASENANKQFYNLQLDNTKTKQAIMFFVSFDEKYVEIITDEKVSKEIPNSHWQIIVDEFISDIKDDQLLYGYLKAIDACSNILIEKFPIKQNDQNELPNEVIELK